MRGDRLPAHAYLHHRQLQRIQGQGQDNGRIPLKLHAKDQRVARTRGDVGADMLVAIVASLATILAMNLIVMATK
jgi:hypothetical protein